MYALVFSLIPKRFLTVKKTVAASNIPLDTCVSKVYSADFFKSLSKINKFNIAINIFNYYIPSLFLLFATIENKLINIALISNDDLTTCSTVLVASTIPFVTKSSISPLKAL